MSEKYYREIFGIRVRSSSEALISTVSLKHVIIFYLGNTLRKLDSNLLKTKVVIGHL